MRSRRAVAEGALAFAGGSVLTIIDKWSVVRHLRTGVPTDLGDPLLQTWQLAWGGHALRHQPLHVFDGNVFAPLRRSLAFSDSLLGYAPFGLVGSGLDAAIVRYNVVFLFAHALAFAGTYVLARQLGTSWRGALLAGAAFAFSPFRVSQSSHLHVLSTGGIPLCLAMLARGHGLGGAGPPRAARPWWAVTGWLVAAWQLSLGFGIGLQFAYLLAVLTAGGALLLLVRRHLPSRGLLAADAAGLLLFLVAGAALAAPYAQVVHDHPEARRDVAQVAFFSPPVRSLFVAPPESRLWGGPSEGLRSNLSWRFEQSLAPGLTVTVLAVLGAAWGPVARRRRAALAAGVLVVCLLALGTHGPAGGRAGFLLLFDHLPGWQGVRTPSRLVTLAWLFLAVLGGLGVERLSLLVRGRGRAAATAGLLTVLALVEAADTMPTAEPARPPSGLRLADLPSPVLVLPSAEFSDNTVMLWSTDGFPQVVNGASGFQPAPLVALRAAADRFPDAAAVAALRAYGVRSVVLLRARLAGTPLQDALERTIEPAAGVTVDPTTVDRPAVVFRIDPEGPRR